MNKQCQVKLDRLIFTAVPRDKAGIENVAGFRRVSDFRPQPQAKLRTYERVLKLRCTTTSCEIVVQHDPQLPWLAPVRITIIGDDLTGVTPEIIDGIIAQCRHHTITLAELAIDFSPAAKVNREFVLRHGRFGKSRRRMDRGGPGTLRYGGRACPKLIRCYFKNALDCYRVEAEIHRSLLRKLGARKVGDLALVAMKLAPAHLKFACLRWRKLAAHLARKFGPEGRGICDEARLRAESSLRKALRYLANNGVHNPHRFLASLKINRNIREALRRWADEFAPDKVELLGKRRQSMSAARNT